MNIGSIAAVYGISLIVFLIVDLLWIGLVANKFYDSQIGHLRGDINWYAAIAFYVIFLAGLLFFALYPAVAEQSWRMALLLGAAYGFFTYAAYDLTNMATLRDWPFLMTIVDVTWGTVLGASVSVGTYAVYALIWLQ